MGSSKVKMKHGAMISKTLLSLFPEKKVIRAGLFKCGSFERATSKMADKQCKHFPMKECSFQDFQCFSLLIVSSCLKVCQKHFILLSKVQITRPALYAGRLLL